MIAAPTMHTPLISTSTGAATAPKTPAPKAATRKTGAIPTDLDGLVDVMGKGLAQLQSLSKAQSAGSELLKSALDKIETAGTTLLQGIGGGLTDAMAELLRLQGEQTDDRVSLAKGQIKDKFAKLSAETQKAMKAIQDRIEAAKSSGFWGSLIKIFKVVATAATAVAAVCSANPLLLAGAALMIAGLITSMASDNAAVQWVAFGLSLAGAACTLGAAFGNPDIPGLTAIAEAISSSLGSATGQAVALGVAVGANMLAGGFEVPKGLAKADELNAQADLQETEAARKRAMKEADEEREMMKTLIEAQAQGATIVSKILRSEDQAEQAAL